MRLFKVFSNNCYQIFPVAIVGKFTCLGLSASFGCWRFVCCGLFSWCFLGCWRFVCCGLFSWCFLGCWRFVCCGLFSWCFLGCWRFVCCGLFSWCFLGCWRFAGAFVCCWPLQLVFLAGSSAAASSAGAGCWRFVCCGLFSLLPHAGASSLSLANFSSARSCAFWPGSAFLGLFLVFLSKIPAASKKRDTRSVT